MLQNNTIKADNKIHYKVQYKTVDLQNMLTPLSIK